MTTITILHYNDVYNIQEREAEPIGGCARFTTLVKKFDDEDPIVTFSGDALSPSIMSTFVKGEQMIPAMNLCKTSVACVGNHDFDFGVEELIDAVDKSTFPWLLSNVTDALTREPLAGAKLTHIMEKKGKKLGFIGIVEPEWIGTLSTVDPEDVVATGFLETARDLAKKLKEEDGCDYVFALTHMRWDHDRKLAKEVPEVDFVLGGHDHDYGEEQYDGRWVVKAGTDFQHLYLIRITFAEDGTTSSTVERLPIDKSLEPDAEAQAIVTKYDTMVEQRTGDKIGSTDVELDGLFKHSRTRETNLGNLIADVFMEVSPADCALLNGGSLRSDKIHPAGDFIMRDLMMILPFMTPIITLKLNGAQLHEAIEAGVSRYPQDEGCFPQVSRLHFAFDPRKPAGSRVDPALVKVGGAYLDKEKDYSMAVPDYLAKGKDGYKVLEHCEQIIDEELAPMAKIAVRNHFKAVMIASGLLAARSHHRQRLMPLIDRQSVTDACAEAMAQEAKTAVLAAWRNKVQQKVTRRRQMVDDEDKKRAKVAPKIEGRIINFEKNPEKEEELRNARAEWDKNQ